MCDEYLEILKKHNIKYLYHFTNISNLNSILVNGICNREYLDINEIEYNYTDKNRFDNNKNCISFSLDNINRIMFLYKKRRLSNDWIIIQFCADELLLDFYDNIYFCKYNASSPYVVQMFRNNKDFLKTVKAFNNMFDINGNLDSQAEILIEGNVSCKYIKSIYVDSLLTKSIVQQLIEKNNCNRINVIIKKEMF